MKKSFREDIRDMENLVNEFRIQFERQRNMNETIMVSITNALNEFQKCGDGRILELENLRIANQQVRDRIEAGKMKIRSISKTDIVKIKQIMGDIKEIHDLHGKIFNEFELIWKKRHG